MTERRDLTGQKFGKLTVIRYDHTSKNYKPVWSCKCDCGNEKLITSQHLLNGDTISCGCHKKEISKIRPVMTSSKHKLVNHRLYRIWHSMKQRCYYPKNISYKYYGARGITVCEEWANEFKPFYDWAVLNGYKDGLTIDRVDFNGNYEPLNCRWVTLKEQGRNKKNVKLILYKGKEYYISDLAEMFNINRSTLYNRLKTGWDIEKALTTKNKRM